MGFLKCHALLLAEAEEELGILFGLLAGGGIDDGGFADVLEAKFVGVCEDLLAVADEDDVGEAVSDGHVGGFDGSLLERFGEHDALFVGLRASNDFVD